MNTRDFTTSIQVEKPVAETFKAIQDFRAWWSEEIIGSTDRLDEVFFYHYGEVHLCKLKLVEIITNERLVYLVLENQFNFVQNPQEWLDTRLVFELTEESGKTRIKFTHEGLVPEYECYPVCEDAWTSYIQGSLQSLITTGQGKPNPKEGGLNQELVEKWGLPDK